MDWQDLPDRKNLFTKRNAVMRDLHTKKIIQHYASNTKIAVVQKCNYKGMTYYRTNSAKENGLDWAFEAPAFGLPNEVAPPAPVPSYSLNSHKPVHRTLQPADKVKQKPEEKQKPTPPNGGEEVEAKDTPKLGFFGKLFRRRKV